MSLQEEAAPNFGGFCMKGPTTDYIFTNCTNKTETNFFIIFYDLNEIDKNLIRHDFHRIKKKSILDYTSWNTNVFGAAARNYPKFALVFVC